MTPVAATAQLRSSTANSDVANTNSSGGCGPSPRDLYEAGQVTAALNLLAENASNRRAAAGGDSVGKTLSTKELSSTTTTAASIRSHFDTPQEEYNGVLLTALATNSTVESVLFLDNMNKVRKAVEEDGGSKATPKGTSERLIVSYNLSLMQLVSNCPLISIKTAWMELKPVIQATRTGIKVREGILLLSCRLGFAMLESMLAVWPMRTIKPVQAMNIFPQDSTKVDIPFISNWLTEIIIDRDIGEVDPQLKFLLSLYKSRIDFFERDRHHRIADANIRSARKELKTAMEIFQHKLRAASNDSTSLASSSYSEELNASSSGKGVGRAVGGGKSPTPLAVGNANTSGNMPRLLQAQNQAVLNLKANTEQLKGNIKKSLILCAEANSPSDEVNGGGNAENNMYYDAIHQNNLGIVYETSGKSHLALHAFSKSVRLASMCAHDMAGGEDAICAPLFDADGTARPDLTLPTLHNAGISSLKTGNYMGAYNCFAIVIREAPKTWGVRPRTWLRVAEACIGKSQERISSESSLLLMITVSHPIMSS